jgi:phosphate transport system substrate-binding protein
MKMKLSLIALLLGVVGAHAQESAPKPGLAPKSAGYLMSDGRIALHGSKELAPLIDALNAKFIETHPGFKFAPELKGSATAMPALAAGATPIAFVLGESSRTDIRGFRAINKHNPTGIRVGYAGYGPRTNGKAPPSIYVNRANPVKGLTMVQLAGLFTSGSPGGDINDWSQLGLGGAWATRRVHLYGLRDDGDFSTTMRQSYLGGSAFAGHYEPLPDDAAVVQAVAADPYGIGLVGWLAPKQAPDTVRIVPLAAETGKPFVLPGKAEITQGAYPMTTPIMLYVDRAPKQAMEPFVRDYLAMVLSNDGQAIIARFADGESGLLPLSQDDLRVERDKLKD